MRHRYRTVVLCLTLVEITLAQSRFTFIPGKLALPPFSASLQEPRVGLRKEIETSKLKVDIGASVDMLEFRPGADSSHRIRLGIDFFTYALSTNSEGLRLQIDAVDGYFGGHVSYIKDVDPDSRIAVRLRLMHVSAHFLDGHYNITTQLWKDGRQPIPFTRDFGELVGAYAFRSGEVTGQIYGGFSYATLIRPVEIRRVELQAGFEFHADELVENVFGRPFNLYASDHFLLRGIPSYIGTNNLEFGVKFGDWGSTGLRIFASHYNGLDVFSQYYDQRRESWGLGFAFDFW